MKITVEADLEVGMILKTNGTRYLGTVCNTLTVAAVGKENFLATDMEGNEHSFKFCAIAGEKYKCSGWAENKEQ